MSKYLLQCVLNSNEMAEDKIKLISYVIRSDYRLKILRALEKSEKTPSLISDKTDISINHVSNILSDLKEKKLARCLNEESKKGRIYKITKRGKSVLEKIDDMEK